MKSENNLGSDPVKQLVFRLAIPSMAAQLVSVLYSIVDRMFIGNIPEIGDTALAGVGVTGPIVNIISAVAFWVGIGGAPIFSIRMGEKNECAARRVLANCFLLLLVLSGIMTVVALLLRDKALLWFGASEATFPYARQYMTIYVLGTVFALLATGMNQFIICQGFAKTGMKSVLLGAVLNIILDPVFIFGFGMGVRGAAAATVISQCASAAYVLWFLFSKKVPVKITFGNYSFAVMRSVLTIGLAPFLIVAFDNLLIISLNTVLQRYGGPERGDLLVTCATITQSFMLLVTMPLGGLTGGTQAILGFNYGARQIGRVRGAMKEILKLGIVFTGFLFLLAHILPQYFILLFTNNEACIEFCKWSIPVYTAGIVPLAFQYTVVDGFTGMGLVRLAMPLSFFRKGLYFLFVFLFPAVWGAEAVFYTEPAVDVIAAIVTSAAYLVVGRSLLKKREDQMQISALGAQKGI